MYGKTKKDILLFGAILGLVAVALGGAVWAWLGTETCDACGQAQVLLGGRTLAPLGVAFYAALFSLGALRGRSRIFYSALLIAASAHLVLLITLYQHALFCAPCVLVGGAAILGAVLSCWADSVNLSRGSVLLPAGAILTHGVIFGLGLLHPGPSMEEAIAKADARRTRATHEIEPGIAKLLVFTRAGCRYCDEFEQDILPELLREFAGRLEVGREQAPGGLPTPTIVISGEVRTVFPGLPPIARLRDAVLRALGKVSHESSMLSKPR